MANLKEIRNRIASVKSTKQVTSAMKMVSAARLRKAQDAIISIRPYVNKLQEVLSSVSGSLESNENIKNVYGDQREIEKVLIVILTSNRGLCGGFNSNVVKLAFDVIENKYFEVAKKGNLDIITIGKKAKDLLKTKNIVPVASYDEIYDDLSFKSASELSGHFMELFVDGKYDRIEIIYNQFKNAAVQVLSAEQFLPIKPLETEEADIDLDYIFEPTQEYIIEELIPKSLKIQFFKILLDSVASEHGARMTAMHIATDNATEIIRDLNLQYNKARQASITNEILEIVSGAEALKG